MRDLSMFLLVAFVSCVTPGAGVLFTVSNAFRHGTANAWRAPLGNMLGVFVISAASAAGIGAIVMATPALFVALQASGALVMAWLGWKNWTAPAIDIASLGQAGSDSLGKGAKDIIRNAVLLQAVNPMLFVFLFSLLPQFVNPADPGYATKAAFLLTVFSLVCLFVHLGYSYTACLAGRLLHGPRFSFWMNRVSATLFWLIAAGVVWDLAEKNLA